MTAPRFPLSLDDAPRIRRWRAEGKTLDEMIALLGWPTPADEDEASNRRKYLVRTVRERLGVDLRGMSVRIGRTHAGTSKTAQAAAPNRTEA